MMSTNAALSELFLHHRLPSGVPLFLLFLYSPLGLCLLLFRLCFAFLLLIVAAVLPKSSFPRRTLLRITCAVLGIVVTQDGSENYYNGKPVVIVSNHVTAIDHIVMETVIPATMVSSTSGCPAFIQWVLGYSEFGGSKNKEERDSCIRESLQNSSVPLLVYPEETTTSGKRAMMHFNPWAFEMSSFVAPVAILVRRSPITQIAPSVVGSNWWLDMFWTLFSPYTNFFVRILPAQSRAEDQTVENFSSMVQKMIASSLNIEATNYTLQDKIEYEKKLEAAKAQETKPLPENGVIRGVVSSTNVPPGNTSASPNRDTRLAQMVRQVKDVLPQVPAETIRRDLGRTRCVDTTITNILEGKVHYVPETEQQQTETKPQPKKSPAAAKSFSRSPEDRMKSFEERKRTMFEEGRQRYIEKHDL